MAKKTNKRQGRARQKADAGRKVTPEEAMLMIARSANDSFGGSNMDFDRYAQALIAGNGYPIELLVASGIEIPHDISACAAIATIECTRRANAPRTTSEINLLVSEGHSLFEKGFITALLRYADDLKRNPEAASLLAQFRENGKILAPEGRAAKARLDRARSDEICRIYDAVRPSFPSGGKGNGDAHRAVVERYKSRTNQTITVRTVRDIVKKAALATASGRQRKD